MYNFYLQMQPLYMSYIIVRACQDFFLYSWAIVVVIVYLVPKLINITVFNYDSIGKSPMYQSTG